MEEIIDQTDTRLKRPLPFDEGFEQAINAIYLEKLKCGINMYQLKLAGIGDFLYRLPEFGDSLSKLSPFDNRSLLEKLDALLANNVEAAALFHQQPKQFNKYPQTGPHI